MTAEEYIIEEERNVENLHKDWSTGKLADVMESYHKESSKELVEALEHVLESKNNIKNYLSFDTSLIEALSKSEKALENHLK